MVRDDGREMPTHSCPSCGSDDGLWGIYKLESIPVHSCILLDSRDAALSFPRGDLTLGFCESCGFASNVDFDPSFIDYSVGYEETQGFSGTFARFAQSLASQWSERYGLSGKHVLEIGCGKGEFLALLCETTGGRGIGFDPAFVPERLDSPAAQNIEVIGEEFSSKCPGLTADFVCCRHTLEHIWRPRAFLDEIREFLTGREAVPVAFELPDFFRVLEERAFWDIYYEHCSYFTAGSLARLFRAAGFEILELQTVYGDQYLILEARLRSNSGEGRTFDAEDDLERVRDEVDAFMKDTSAQLSTWRARLSDWRSRGRKVVLWGSGSKAVGFLTTLKIENEVDCVVDINPHKHSKYMPGCAQQIVAPAKLKEVQPDVVVVMNPVYVDEIKKDLNDIGVDADVIALE